MGKASRRKNRDAKGPKLLPAPFEARPFEGLPHETEWVAMREIIPAATATVTVRVPEDAAPEGAPAPAWAGLEAGSEHEVTLATVLPLAWPGLHRAEGDALTALQTGSTTGDPSRDIAQAILTTLAAQPGQPVTTLPQAMAHTPRLQDIVVSDAMVPELREDFGFWVSGDGDALDDAGQLSLERANEAIVPTERLDSVDSAFWCRMGDRTYIRWLLPHTEDAATTALARLKAAGEHTLGGESTLLGAFRAAGVLVPVFEVDPAVDPQEWNAPLGELAARLEARLGDDSPLTPDERRAREGFSSRQVTIR
ncbi:hypothetical protein SAMN05445756_1154 [Kytococcus aerolatus]|uniref:DUF5926 domain-containing protein n=1 Tax=Kytococcus aerolatus TaxID=592308 RepID=A0A212TF01_9MICO|nr:DUF5926 family protein [Kytococcus aerolatus]SNC64648.1 hypothetical protein SAMN05445756_1154 [Kytococcus aerolatus]